MCINYERQLQKMQDENQKYQNLASNLQMALDQEKVWTCFGAKEYLNDNVYVQQPIIQSRKFIISSQFE